jgi:hypothetical protein
MYGILPKVIGSHDDLGQHELEKKKKVDYYELVDTTKRNPKHYPWCLPVYPLPIALPPLQQRRPSLPLC